MDCPHNMPYGNCCQIPGVVIDYRETNQILSRLRSHASCQLVEMRRYKDPPLSLHKALTQTHELIEKLESRLPNKS